MSTNSPSPKSQWTVWGGLFLVGLTAVGLFVLSKVRVLPPTPPVIGKVSDFNLTNQFGHQITLDSLRGKIWVADIIFTRCGGPCPAMTKTLSELQSALPNSPVKFISLTTDPEFDTPAVLKRYAERFGADSNRWWFLTGTKEEIGRLAIDGLKLTALEKDASSRTDANDLFIHATLFVVVDRSGQLRAAVEGR